MICDAFILAPLKILFQRKKLDNNFNKKEYKFVFKEKGLRRQLHQKARLKCYYSFSFVSLFYGIIFQHKYAYDSEKGKY